MYIPYRMWLRGWHNSRVANEQVVISLQILHSIIDSLDCLLYLQCKHHYYL